jgi:hypothetical protein
MAFSLYFAAIAPAKIAANSKAAFLSARISASTKHAVGFIAVLDAI